MYSHTKKVGSLGRYGPRVGRKLRNEAVKIERDAKNASECPTCARGKLKRESAGVWKCKTCNFTFAGGTHIPRTKKTLTED